MAIHSNVENAIQQYNKRANINISMAEGANILTTIDDSEVWIEVNYDSDMLIIHTEVRSHFSHNMTENQLLMCLKLNGTPAQTKGAWLCVNDDTDTLRLCMSVPVELIEVNFLEQSVSTILEVLEEVSKVLS